MDITELSVVELKRLLESIPKELAKREKTDKQRIRKELSALAAEQGYTLDELLTGELATEKAPKRTVAPKYRNPSEQSLTWTGRGRKPLWVENFLSEGGSLDDLVI